ncbi:MAG: MXAN_5187 C-terminal domain-containing protein [Myxococcota bacterium]
MATHTDEWSEIEEKLQKLDENLTRLRVSYEQYFAGVLKREPQDLRARVQRTISYFTNKAPRNSGQKFRFNQLNARFQSYRQLWGRTLRQIEAGTYKPHLFKASLHERQRRETRAATSSPAGTSEPDPTQNAEAWLDRLAEELGTARRKTGEATDAVDREKLARAVRRQTAALRKKYGDRNIQLKVVIEGKRAKLKAFVKR